MNKKTIEFLRESNNIEDVWDDDSLVQALYAWDHIIKQNKLTPNLILKTHKILMAHHLGLNGKGHYRKVQVWVGGHEKQPWYTIPDSLAGLCKDIETSIKVPGLNGHNIKIDHIRFENIHPFIDGNGRIGRIILNWERAKAGLPILVIKLKDRQKYYKWFK
jgi:Fic family protein